ncbi:MAG: hypothetical protein HY823_02960 [Acidobacteria bacterium]|nr:hypothetical protein [Acidobacteriota bacterium]
MSDRIPVFVAYSYEKTPPPGETKSDLDVASWFIELIKSRSLSYQVLAGSKPIPMRIDEKIKADIADCSCLVAIFTKRHRDETSKHWLPSQFVLCEAASAIGFFYNTNKLICGFYEEGVDPRDLALITIGGLELIPFKRETLNDDKEKFITYMKKIPELLAGIGTPLLFPGPPYTQTNLRKIFTIYSNGTLTVQNITTMLITDASRFENDFNGEIPHEIFHPRGGFSSLKEIISSPMEKRRESSFFRGLCRKTNTKRIGTPLRIRVGEESSTGGKVFVSFYDKNDARLRFKNQDTIYYQYAWSLPMAYPKNEEELLSNNLETEIGENNYCIAEVIANHGMVKNLEVELRFERFRDPLFDKSPFYQQTSSYSPSPVWSKSAEVPRTEREDDHEMWFQSFLLEEKNFQGRLRIMWRPASGKKPA